VETELEYQHESTGRILVYAPTREAEATPPDEPGEIMEVETMEMATTEMMAMMMDKNKRKTTMSKRSQKRTHNLLWQVMKVEWKPWIP